MLRGGGRYEGDYRDDKRTGRDIYTWTDGNCYEGDYLNGNRHGQGIYTWTDGDR